MELAANQFSKGLLKDTNPMIQENTTLSDALNATLITMAGNELILLNDMGNRKIDNAFLPPGYVPVGIKEYGGIIYLACYNPITNKGLVGSFPSPERKMEELDTKEKPIALLHQYEEIDSKKYLISDVLLILLALDMLLHAGDKFIIYDSTLENNKDYISNYFNTSNGKINSPKNKLYTLSIGVLNSQNEFVDITKDLCRWDNEGNIIKYTRESDLFKFNDGYFIPEGKKSISWENDSSFIEQRQSIEANTYSYKLIGPLYLKILLNHFLEFDYEIFVDKTEDGIEINLETTITYNCPDYGVSYSNYGDEIYNSYEIVNKELSNNSIIDEWFDFELILLSSNNAPIDWKLLQQSSVDLTSTTVVNASDFEQAPTGPETIGGQTGPETIGSQTSFIQLNNNYLGSNVTSDDVNCTKAKILGSSYDNNTNLYTVKILKTYTYETSDYDYKLHYIIKPFSRQDDDKIYLKNLIEEGNIDLSKIGSNTVNVTEWRFLNDEDSTLLTLSFEAYPRYGESFELFDLDFHKHDDIRIDPTALYHTDPNFTISDIPFKNGRVTKGISWEEYGILPQELYKVVINIRNNSNEVVSSNERWFLSTALMNDCYNTVADYGDTTNEMVQDKLTIKFDIKYTKESTVSISNISEQLSSEYNGQLINTSSGNIGLKYQHGGDISYAASGVEIKNPELYPSYILLSSVGSSYITGFDHDSLNIDTIENNNEGSIDYPSGLEFVDVSNDGINTCTVEFKDVFVSSSDLQGVINNYFESVDVALPDTLDAYGGLAIGWNNKKTHYLDVVGPHELEAFAIDGLHDHEHIATPLCDGTNCYEVTKEVLQLENQGSRVQDFYIKNNLSLMQLSFYGKFHNNNFIYYFNSLDAVTCDGNNCIGQTIECNCISTGTSFPSGWRTSWGGSQSNSLHLPFSHAARVWWRTNWDKFALLERPYIKWGSESFSSFLKDHLFGTDDVYYCSEDNVGLDSKGLYKFSDSNYKYNLQYKFNFTVKFNITYELNTVVGANLIGSNDDYEIFKFPSTVEEEVEDKMEFKSKNLETIIDNLLGNMSCIAIIDNNIFNTDIEGHILDSKSFYKYISGIGLLKLELPYVVMTGSPHDIVYDESKHEVNNLSYRYDLGGGNEKEDKSYLDYLCSDLVIVGYRKR